MSLSSRSIMETAPGGMAIREELRGIQGIVFDAVGTLIKPSPSVSVAYTQAAARQGVVLEPREVGRRFREQFAIDEVDEQRGPLATDEATEHRRWKRLVSLCLPELPDPDLAFEELWEHFADPRSWVVFPDVADGVKRLQSMGLRICVASNFDGRLHRVAAGHPELLDWVEPLVISSEVGYRKPHPEFYRVACERLDLPAHRVLSVGDDIRNDVTGPSAVGLKALLLDRHGEEGSPAPSVPDLHRIADEWSRSPDCG